MTLFSPNETYLFGKTPRGDPRRRKKLRWLRLHPEDYRQMPWKNGGGVTEEIALDPPGGSWEGPSRILWRISMAQVASSGPFSLFPGYDRLLAILDGVELELRVEGKEPERLSPREGVGSFPGDVPTEGVLLGPPCRDFNLVVDRARGEATLRFVSLDEEEILRSKKSVGILFAVQGEVGGRGPSPEGEPFALSPGDCLLWRREEGDPEAFFELRELRGPRWALWGEILIKI